MFRIFVAFVGKINDNEFKNKNKVNYNVNLN